MRSPRPVLPTPVEITGLTEVPEAGELFEAVEDEKLARELADKRTAEAKERQFAAYTKVTLDNLFDQMAANDMKELPHRGQGGCPGLRRSHQAEPGEALQRRGPRPGHPCGRGAPSPSRMSRWPMPPTPSSSASTSAPTPSPRRKPRQAGVEMRMYRVIYDAINDVSDAMKGMLAPRSARLALGEAPGPSGLQDLQRGHRGRLPCHQRQDHPGCPAASGA